MQMAEIRVGQGLRHAKIPQKPGDAGCPSRREPMKSSARFLSALLVTGSLGGATAIGQSGADTVDAHVAAAKAAAGTYHSGLFTSLCSPANIQPPATPQRGQRAGGPGTRAARTARSIHVARGTGQGVRQPVLRRHDRVLRVGGQDIGRHHPARHDLRLLGRGRSGRRPEEAGTGSGHHQVRAGQPRPHRPFRRREVPAGALRHQGPDVGRRLGADCRVAESRTSRRATWSSATVRSSRSATRR